MTLGSRLAATYAAVILIALLIFAAIAVVSIDRTLRATMDSRLSTDARAAASLVDVRHGTIVADADDRRQFLTLVAGGDQSLMLDSSGRVRLSSVLKPPSALLALPNNIEDYYTVGKGEAAVRVFVLPVMRDTRYAGTVVVWRSSDWIEETDRGAAIAFALAAIVIAILALIAGSAVTRRALDDAFARQRRFTADASHELRAPLAVIRAEADLALRKQRDAGDYRAAMETIAAESDRMETLIEDLLSAARAESGAIERKRLDLCAIVNRVADRLSSTGAAKGAAIIVSCPEGAVILAERHALERAILAIAHNAVKYAPENGRVILQVRRDGGTVELTVRDNGPGFTSEALDHGLERFWRDDSGRPHGGTGLGLAIAKSSVQAFGGSIALENGPEGGAAVRLRFPAA